MVMIKATTYGFITAGCMAHAVQQMSNLPSTAQKTLNLCLHGKIVPEVYGIGAQKAATTYFWEVFRNSPSYADPDVDNSNPMVESQLYHSIKELHNFDDDNHWNLLGKEEGWLSQFPACQQKHRTVISDFSPGYLYSSYSLTQLSNMYSGHADRLQFVVSLREPLARMYSDFWMFKNLDYFHNFWVENPHFTFKTLAYEVIISSHCYRSGDFSDNNCNLTWHDTSFAVLPDFVKEFVNKCKYPVQLRSWFSHFSARQFTVMPMSFVFDSSIDESSPVGHMWTDLGMKFPTEEPGHEEENNGEYPAIEKNLEARQLDRLRHVMGELANPKSVADVLSNSGASLWKCQNCNKVEIAEWIRSGW